MVAHRVIFGAEAPDDVVPVFGTVDRKLTFRIEAAATPDRPTAEGDISQEDFDNYINILNDQISPFDLEIRSAKHQTTKQVIYALVNAVFRFLFVVNDMGS